MAVDSLTASTSNDRIKSIDQYSLHAKYICSNAGLRLWMDLFFTPQKRDSTVEQWVKIKKMLNKEQHMHYEIDAENWS